MLRKHRLNKKKNIFSLHAWKAAATGSDNNNNKKNI